MSQRQQEGREDVESRDSHFNPLLMNNVWGSPTGETCCWNNMVHSGPIMVGGDLDCKKNAGVYTDYFDNYCFIISSEPDENELEMFYLVMKCFQFKSLTDTLGWRAQQGCCCRPTRKLTLH